MKMGESYDYLFKFLVIGNAGTGKSCILHHFLENKFKADSTHTIGVEFGSKVVSISGKPVKLQIWDTAGQERFQSVTRSYYRGAAGVLLVYDLTNRDSYNAVSKWLADARALSNRNLSVILIGNKRDLDNGATREVTYSEAGQFAQENDLLFMETSAFTGENIADSFISTARQILSRIDNGAIDPDTVGIGVKYGETALRRGSTSSIPTKANFCPQCYNI